MFNRFILRGSKSKDELSVPMTRIRVSETKWCSIRLLGELEELCGAGWSCTSQAWYVLLTTWASVVVQ